MVDHDAPRPPADQGLSSLGLLMGLVGSVMAPLTAAFLLVRYGELDRLAQAGQPFDGRWWFLLVMVTGFVRGLVHRQAGIRLWRVVPGDPPVMTGIGHYLVASIAHATACVGFLRVQPGLSPVAPAAVGAMALAWPVTIGLVLRQRRFRALGPRPPLAEDSGFDGLAVMMAVLGFVGLLAAAALGAVALSFPRRVPQTPLLLMFVGSLFMRAALQLTTGVRAVQGRASASAPALRRYGELGTQLALAGGIALLMWTLLWGVDLVAAAVAVAALLALLAWPSMVARYVSWRDTGDAEADRVRRSSPDGGLAALGWMLLGLAGFSLVGAVVAQAASPAVAAQGRTLLGAPIDHDLAWWTIPLALAQAWTALALLGVWPHRRRVATAWAIAAVLATITLRAGAIGAVLDAPLERRAIGVAALLAMLTPPVATLLLLHRRALPRAIARVRPAATARA